MWKNTDRRERIEEREEEDEKKMEEYTEEEGDTRKRRETEFLKVQSNLRILEV